MKGKDKKTGTPTWKCYCGKVIKNKFIDFILPVRNMKVIWYQL